MSGRENDILPGESRSGWDSTAGKLRRPEQNRETTEVRRRQAGLPPAGVSRATSNRPSTGWQDRPAGRRHPMPNSWDGDFSLTTTTSKDHDPLQSGMVWVGISSIGVGAPNEKNIYGIYYRVHDIST
ncbi:hypothetical protein GUJ93_ZPchr0012g18776 [Zizania palustris]|uniref:Uncharacterized protein n=1 Tax=Zizania palustris TaxID=103762 RepID=A0A8J6BPC6_ZIZPA|nr:hypothetical protein GUJ93_ZPchr0012g18776 [Zizania palustris]